MTTAKASDFRKGDKVEVVIRRAYYGFSGGGYEARGAEVTLAGWITRQYGEYVVLVDEDGYEHVIWLMDIKRHGKLAEVA